MAPPLVMVINRPGLPTPLQVIWRMPAEEIADYLCRFALAGLKAIGDDYTARAAGSITGFI